MEGRVSGKHPGLAALICAGEGVGIFVNPLGTYLAGLGVLGIYGAVKGVKYLKENYTFERRESEMIEDVKESEIEGMPERKPQRNYSGLDGLKDIVILPISEKDFLDELSGERKRV